MLLFPEKLRFQYRAFLSTYVEIVMHSQRVKWLEPAIINTIR